MHGKSKPTDMGWLIKRKLAEMQMSQKEFCKAYNIRTTRLSNIIYGTRSCKNERKIVAEILNIPELYNEELELCNYKIIVTCSEKVAQICEEHNFEINNFKYYLNHCPYEEGTHQHKVRHKPMEITYIDKDRVRTVVECIFLKE
ncbi:putative transcriptional regulator [Paenibacillus sp. 1182]|uniref:helix-turn-helix domain-containing protein n=1 Tax=Paenibacillus sp. 1182 TaxID=2806565 RepID=UPI001B6C46EF|nr:helix-turn-helix transcriptional regulator [Paenibacillus sp. 1182]MBP1309058.1 putative transcriptional regulator [Paenibacillus sp. 1182]